MRAAPPTVPADMTLAQTLDHVLRANPAQAFPVVAPDGTVMGTISMDSARRLGARNPMRPARDALIPLNQTPAVDADETLDDALEWLSGREGLVLRNGRLVGALGANDVERWYRRVIEGHITENAEAEPIPPRPDR